MRTEADPPRLSASSTELGRLIASANHTYDAVKDENRAWNRLEISYSNHQDRVGSRLAYVAIPLVAAAAGIVLLMHGRGHSPSPLVAADPAAVAVSSPQEIAAAVASNQPVDVPTRPVASPPSSFAANPSNHVVDCQVALKSGPTRDAMTCLERRTSGDSIDAQRAIVDLARMKREQGGDLASAITLLESYRQRFPDGVLRGEVDFALVELLPKVGRAREAMQASGALLETPWGRTRSSQLHLLRGTVAQDQLDDPERALQEFAQIKNEFGAIGDDATLRSAECFERTGHRKLAIEAYETYLSRPGASQVVRAKERLQALRAVTSP